MASDIHEMLDRARDSMDRSLQTLNAAMEKVSLKLAESDEYDDKLGSHLAWVTAKVAEITTSLRQLEKHDRTMSRSPEQRFQLVCAYIENELDPSKVDHLRKLIAGLDHGRRVLS